MAEPSAPGPGAFDRDTAVRLEASSGPSSTFAAEVIDGWQAGRGPHGGYLAAMMLRALSEALADPLRPPRSLTIHFLRAPQPGPVQIKTALEREGRSLSTLSARLEQDGQVMALALAAFSGAWSEERVSELEMPQVEPPDSTRRPGTLFKPGPPFARHITVQRRFGQAPFAQAPGAMETGGWLGLVEPRAIDALSLAFFCDALIPAPFVRIREWGPAPTIDITIHFRAPLPAAPGSEHAPRDRNELCLSRVRTGLISEGFFEEDGVIWGADGTLLAQSRQLALLLPATMG